MEFEMQKFATEKIGQFAVRVLLTEPTLKNQEVLDLVKREFPDAKTTMACIAWYKSDIKKKGTQPIAKEITLEMIDAELAEAKAKVEELEGKREIWLEENASKIEERKAKLRAELEALEAV